MLSQLVQPLGSLPLLEDEASPAASVPLPLSCSSSHSRVGRDLSLWRDFFCRCCPFLLCSAACRGCSMGCSSHGSPRDSAESCVGNLLEVTSDTSGLDPILSFSGHLFPPFSCETPVGWYNQHVGKTQSGAVRRHGLSESLQR